MTYSNAELIRWNLTQLRKHMLAQGCTVLEWRAALLADEREAANLPPMTRPGNVEHDT